MIRKITIKDRSSVLTYLIQKQNISLSDAKRKFSSIVKSNLPSLIDDDKDLQGICWVEKKLINDKKEKFINLLVNNWRLAETFLQVLHWQLGGDYYFLIPRHDFLNRTFNKNRIKFLKIEGDNHLYTAKFEKRTFLNYKQEDNE